MKHLASIFLWLSTPFKIFLSSPPRAALPTSSSVRRIFNDPRAVPLLYRKVVDHRPHDLCRGAQRIQRNQRRQAILIKKLLTQGVVLMALARAQNRPVQSAAVLHQTMQIPGLVRTVKMAEPDVNDPRRQV